jgi:hypothetical protein
MSYREERRKEKEKDMKKKLHRQPTVENKYHLRPKDIKKAKVINPEKLHQKPFWRNDVVQAWCVSGVVGNNKDIEFGTESEYWIGFYDKNAKSHAGKVELSCTVYGGMCGYEFDKFYNPNDIDNEDDLLLQERLLKRINWMLDEGIISIPGVKVGGVANGVC